MGDPAVITSWESSMDVTISPEWRTSWLNLKKERRAVRGRVSKNVNILNTTIADTTAEEEDIEVALSELKAAKEALENVDLKAWEIIAMEPIPQTRNAVEEADRLIGEKWTKDAYKAMAKGQKALKNLRPPGPLPTAATVSPTPAAHVAEVKLPKVDT